MGAPNVKPNLAKNQKRDYIDAMADPDKILLCRIRGFLTMSLFY